MVEELTVYSEHVVRLAVVLRDPVAVDLRCAIWAAWVKRSVFVLWWWARAKHFAGACLVETNAGVVATNGFEHVQRAHTRCLSGVEGLIETHAHM